MSVHVAEKIDRKLDAVTKELVNANLHYQLFLDINESFKDYKVVINQSPIFWGLTRQAIFDSAILGLCRVYDDGPKTNGLPNVLQIIENHPETFDEEHFKNRMAQVNYLDGVAADSRRPDPLQLELDIEFASTNNDAVRRLLVRRNNLLAHRSSKLVEQQTPLADKHLSTFGDFSMLLDGGLKIVNRYLGLFRATEQVAVFLGGNDHGFVFKAGLESLENRKRKLREEATQHGIDIDI
jgi:hypothetical protein